MSQKKKSTIKSAQKSSGKKINTPQKFETLSIREELCKKMLADTTYTHTFSFSDVEHHERPSVILEVLISES